ncbi:HAD-IB family hydrolase [Micromonospora zamorensis]|uniref:HAD-IB family hydrolase n=1 Tax=Micromonospora zamorensis TaxID=709883 RepID=UPI003D965A20
MTPLAFDRLWVQPLDQMDINMPDDNQQQLEEGHLLLTGATGFVGQAILQRVLANYPTTRITLLTRSRRGTSGEQRITKLMQRSVFQQWREAVGDDAVKETVARRVRVLDADLGNGQLILPDDLTTMVHAASTVSFDPPIDQAFRSNVRGVHNLYQAVLRSAGRPHIVHVSTAYVSAIQRGLVPERSLNHDLDWQTELKAAEAARAAVELDSRHPGVLREFLAAAGRDHGRSGPRTTAAAAEERRREWVDRQLVERGRLRAQVAGWTDIYTFTKALGERVAETLTAGRLPLSVVRPAIVESALCHPYPGWIEGFKMAEPLILAFGRGQLSEFPGRPDGILDIIPVDLVVNAILAVAAEPPPTTEPRYYHIGSGARNPLTFRDIYQHMRSYFTKDPMPNGGYGHITPPTWTFPGAARTERMLGAAERVLDVAQSALLVAPQSARSRPWQDELTRQQSEVDSLRRISDLYGSYVQNEATYSTDELLALHHALPPDQVAEHGFDPADIDWTWYLQDVHFPTVTGSRRRADARRWSSVQPSPRPLEPPTDRPTVAVFDLEGTVVGAKVIETYLLARLSDLPRSRWAGELVDLVRGLPRYLGAERRDQGEFLRTFLRRYEGATEADLRRLVTDRIGDALLRRSHPEAIRQVRRHRAAGHRTVLVTGSLEVLVAPVAKLFDEVVCSRPNVRDGRFTGFLDSPPPVAEARSAWLRHYAESLDADLASSYAYGDSYSDRPTLEAVGNPVAVNPDLRLYRHARSKRWPVVNWTAHTMTASEVMIGTVNW